MSRATDSQPQPRRRRFAVAAAAVLSLTVLPIWVGFVHTHVASWGRIYRQVEETPARDVVMVLGARAHPDRPSSVLAARLDVAIELYNAGKARVIVVTGANTQASNYETQVMQDYLEARGIPANRIVQDEAGFDTYDSCIRMRDVFGVRDLITVSQTYHLYRTISTCRALGVDAIGVGDDTAAQRWPASNVRGQVRELFAGVKMEIDLLRNARATQSPPSTAVTDALGTP